MHPAYSVILFTTASGAGYGLLALIGLELTADQLMFLLLAVPFIVSPYLVVDIYLIGRQYRQPNNQKYGSLNGHCA